MNRRKRLKRKKKAQEIARERMDILFSMAEKEALYGDMDLSRRYVCLLRRIGMRYNVPLRHKHRIYICRGCNTFLVSGSNARVRLDKHRVRVECLSCGRVQRFPYIKEKKKEKIKREDKTEDIQ